MHFFQRLLVPILLLVSQIVFAASDSPASKNENLFTTVKPDATLVIEKHPFGPDMVQITMLDPKYPPDTLKAQIETLAQKLNSTARAVAVFDYQLEGQNPKMGFVKATFTVDGLIDVESGDLRIEPLLQSFTGAPKEHEIHGLTILYVNQRPAPNRFKQFVSPAVQLQAQYNVQPAGLEYRVKLLTQNPKEIQIPDSAQIKKQAEREIVQELKQKSPQWPIYLLIFIVSLAVGVGIYFLVMKLFSKTTHPMQK